MEVTAVTPTAPTVSAAFSATGAALAPVMPSAEIIEQTALFWGVDPQHMAELYAEFCGKLAGDWGAFWRWRDEERTGDSKRAEIISEIYPHELVADIPMAFFDANTNINQIAFRERMAVVEGEV